MGELKNDIPGGDIKLHVVMINKITYIIYNNYMLTFTKK
jgi:hypothetical protein